MNVIYSDMPHENWANHSIFLIGPTPRDRAVASWRPEALRILEALGYAGTVLVPEWSKVSNVAFAEQVAWEYYGTEHATVLAAWVPREMKHMPVRRITQKRPALCLPGQLPGLKGHLAPPGHQAADLQAPVGVEIVHDPIVALHPR